MRSNDLLISRLFDNLQIVPGDWILLRVSDNFFIENKIKISVFYNYLRERITDNGLIVALAFSNRENIAATDGVYIPKKTKSYCGMFSNYMINSSDTIRTTHPTNSVVVFGKEKDKILMEHNFKTYSYDFMKPILDNNAVMLNIDCDPISPGFTTVHYNEKLLGLYKKSILNGLYSCKVKIKDDLIENFTRRDFGLCSKSQDRFYKFYINAGVFNTGKIYNSIYTSIRAVDAYIIESKILSNDRNFHTCKGFSCKSCTVYRKDRLHFMLLYYLKLGLKFL